MPRILAVEDEKDQLKMLEDFFKGEGWDFTGAATGAKALKEAASARPDVILLDVNLPDINGFELCRTIKENPATSGIPVALISGDVRDKERIMKGLGMGSAIYLLKPVDLDVLKAKLEAVLRMGKP